ncbi:MAG: benzoate-CoA ligase family protein [Candidatus Tectimicrobiota bacterium]
MMQDHTVRIDRTTSPSTLQWAPVFNVAVPLIDRHVLEGRAGKGAIETVDGTVTYGELAEQVNRCGNLLLSMGAVPGDRLLMVLQDCPEFFYLFWGAIKAGLVPVPVNPLLRAPDYQYLMHDSGCAVVVYSPDCAAEVEAALATLPVPPRSLRAVGDHTALPARLRQASPYLAAVPSTPDDVCLWLYSSGSTGRPKGVIHRQRDMLVTCVRYAADTLGMQPEDRCFSAAKLFFSYGLGNAMTFPLWLGATSILSPQRPSPAMTFAMIERFRPTLYFGVPTLYAAQLRALDSAACDLSSLRLCISAGEALPAEIFRRWRAQTGLLILDGIGSTEAMHIFISNRPDDYKPGSSGRPVPGYEARIVDEAGAPVAPGQIGRLFIKGESCALSYWNNPAKTSETMCGDWLNTGDTYVQDREGYYTYCGRSDDMLKVGGLWCSPVEIENRLIEHPQVLEAAVVGRPDADQLTRPEAYIVLKRPEEASEMLVEALVQHCQGALARYKIPRRFHFVPTLPRTATGKIQRFKLRQM